MCRLPGRESQGEDPISPTTTQAFSCHRLNPTTFVLEENDRWGENPLIYVKVFPLAVVLIDTGCGGMTQSPNMDTTLKVFIETAAVPDNSDAPLNPGGTKKYVIICSHCHYDHIGGIPEFVGTPGLAIWASALGREYIQDPELFPKSSLCRYVGMNVPEYSVTNWAYDGQAVTSSDQQDLGLVIYQTPGHCPDELAVWDPQERFLFVGDTTYESGPTLFPNGGDVLQYRDSINNLRHLVQEWNTGADDRRVKIACGHITKDADAESLLDDVADSLGRVLRSEIPVIDQTLENYAWAGGEPVLEFRPPSMFGVYFQGLKSAFQV